MCEICSKLEIKVLGKCYWHHSIVFIAKLDHILRIVLLFPLLAMNNHMPAGKV